MTKDITNSELRVMETLHGIAAGHAGTSHERLVLLDLDPEKYPDQRLSSNDIRAGAEGPLVPEAASSIAKNIDPRFSALESLFLQRHHETVGIQRIIEQLRGGSNVINGSDHAELIDIALSHLALAGIVKRAEADVRTGLIVSKMVDFLGVELDGGVVTARQLLSYGFDRTFLTIPRTASTEGLFEKDEFDKYNEQARKRIRGSLDRQSIWNRRRAPFFLGVALPGSVNKPLIGDENTSVIGRVADGTLSITSVPNTYTVATSIRLHKTDPKFFIDELPLRLETHDDIVNIMGRLVAGMSELDGGTYVYDEYGSLPVVRSPHGLS